MRRLTLLTLLLALIAWDCQASTALLVRRSSAPAGCPAWGTYGTSTGNILFAWDGAHASGQLYACLDNESTVLGVNTNGVISGSGSDTIWTKDANDDNLTWDISGGSISADSPLTICLQLYMHTTVAQQYSCQMEGDSNTYLYGNIKATGAVDAAWREGVTTDTITGTNLISDATWTTVGYSWQWNVAGNDHAVSADGTTWQEEDDDLVQWTAAVANFMLGDGYLAGSTDQMDIKRAVIIAGYAQSCPSW